jgi:hypothetical protein
MESREQMKGRTKSKSLDCLASRYYKAANELREYRRSAGLNPGVRVMCLFADTQKTGTIAPYGEDWSRVDSMSVPVLLDSGGMQPWSMEHLTILK